MQKRCLWILTDIHDPLELPIYVADSASQMARYCGISVDSVCSRISHTESGRIKGRTKFHRVHLTEEEWEWCHR